VIRARPPNFKIIGTKEEEGGLREGQGGSVKFNCHEKDH